MRNRLRELITLGQSPWQDNIHRGMLSSGALARMVRDHEVTGLTSNPTIFEQAIRGQTDYDDALHRLVRTGKHPAQIVDLLMIEDIRAAAKIFAPVYKHTKGADGFVSIEVAPNLARDTAATVREARRLWKAVGRPNLMVKIPATREGLPAIEQCLADGININVTLIFSLARYEAVMEAYLTGLERRMKARKPVRGIASVASFFVSRVDTAIDKILDARIAELSMGEPRRALERLRGRAAIANAKLAYAIFRERFRGPRWEALAAAGAHVQRPLWASTSTKNPAYPDVYYIDALVGPDTVNTIPPATLTAFKDHGHPESRLDQGTDEARRVIDRLEAVGISIATVTDQLEVEGVAAFVKSFDDLVAGVAARVDGVRLQDRATLRVGGALARAVNHACDQLDTARFGERLWHKDSTLWKADDAAAQREIAARLGWLDVVGAMRARLDDLRAFATGARADGFTHALLCGMGGSSLAPEVLRTVFGVARGGLDLAVLDSTDPAVVLAAGQRSDPARTLYLVSSKSGGTAEVNAFLAFSWDRVVRARGEAAAGAHFVAITDPGTSLERLAGERRFRRVFSNPPDIGGRYSALSYFGLVPAALLGMHLDRLLDRAEQMLRASGPGLRAAQNPSLQLGAFLGACALAGRDKVTFLPGGKVASFAAWVEQLLAESTGKEGRGVVPVVGEPVGATATYGKDRVFVSIQVEGTPPPALARLARAGHPTVAYKLADPHDLGGEFVRWEIATAAAGHLLGINPFDQPNVQESKEITVRLLAEHGRTGRLPDVGAALTPTAPDLAERLTVLLRGARGRAYLAVNAYLPTTPRVVAQLDALRTIVRDRFGIATTVGFGPRFLHSTGQLHKGGPATGVFLQLTCSDPTDLTVPGEAFGFSTLKAAQALGDLQALAARGRPVLHVHLDGTMLERELKALGAAIATPQPTARAAGRRPPARATARRQAR
ncbi:MAG: bifunctional transaldolase/phosoglucose isomerase [Candidatus Binatia bacterium]